MPCEILILALKATLTQVKLKPYQIADKIIRECFELPNWTQFEFLRLIRQDGLKFFFFLNFSFFTTIFSLAVVQTLDLRVLSWGVSGCNQMSLYLKIKEKFSSKKYIIVDLIYQSR
jgi:hypothetical protein